jgi:hypothetical protein
LNDHKKYYYEYPLPFRIIFHPIGSKKKDLIYEDEKVEVPYITAEAQDSCLRIPFQGKSSDAEPQKEMILHHKVP